MDSTCEIRIKTLTVRTSGRGFVVTIPASFADTNGIKKGDDIALLQDTAGRLILEFSKKAPQ